VADSLVVPNRRIVVGHLRDTYGTLYADIKACLTLRGHVIGGADRWPLRVGLDRRGDHLCED
jgi:hypothetical protein